MGHSLLMLSLEDNECRVYKPKDDRIYETRVIFQGIDFWQTRVLDSRFDLCIIDVFSKERIQLPPLESLWGGYIKVERVGDRQFRDRLESEKAYGYIQTLDDLRGLLWIDDKSDDFNL